MLARIFVCLILSLALVKAVLGAEEGAEWRAVRLLSRPEGLPHSVVNAVVQCDDGYLWAATYGGLARFDGVRFVQFTPENTPELRSQGLIALCPSRARGGVLVVDDGGLVLHVRRDRVELVGGLPQRRLQAIAEDETGRIWIMDETRDVVRISDGAVFPFPSDRGNAWSLSQLVAEPGSGRVWALRNGTVDILGEGTMHPTHLSDRHILAIASAIEGMWVLRWDRLERWVGDRRVSSVAVPSSLGQYSLGSVSGLPDGSFAVGTSLGGLWRIDEQGTLTQISLRGEGAEHDWITGLWVDREKTLWAASKNGGVIAAARVPFRLVMPPDRWEGRPLISAFIDAEDSLWVGTEGAGIYQRKAGKWTKHDLFGPSANRYVWTFGQDEWGRLWAGGYGAGAFVQSEGVFREREGVAPQYRGVPYYALSESGTLWAATDTAILPLQQNDLGPRQNYPDGATLSVTALACFGEDVWVGTNGAGLLRRHGEGWQFFGASEGLPALAVPCLFTDRARRLLWIGLSGKGLVVWNGMSIQKIDTNGELDGDTVLSLLSQPTGTMWLTTLRGVVRLDLDYAGSTPVVTGLRRYGGWDGLPSVEGAGPGAVDRAGRLYFPLRTGLVEYLPGAPSTSTVAPPVLIEGVRAGGVLLAPVDATGRIEARPGSSRFEFEFTALTFVDAERARLRYRLRGVHEDWVEVKGERRASYSYLPPGSYQFEVQSETATGVKCEAPAVLTLEVLPFFWQTLAFRFFGYVVGVAAIAGLVAYVVRWRWRRRMERLERDRAVERERNRIARDIHDDLGSHLTRIGLLAQHAKLRQRDQPEQAERVLDQLQAMARETTRTMDEIVWAVNPSHDSLESLATYLAAFAQEFLRTAGITCRWEFPLALPEARLGAEVRHSLFLCAKEALNNAVKHSGARGVWLKIEIADHGFVLSVRDDGRGMPPGAAGAEGNGLRHLHQRMTEIGGRLEIREGTNHQGTELRFSVPLDGFKADPTP